MEQWFYVSWPLVHRNKQKAIYSQRKGKLYTINAENKPLSAVIINHRYIKCNKGIDCKKALGSLFHLLWPYHFIPCYLSVSILAIFSSTSCCPLYPICAPIIPHVIYVSLTHTIISFVCNISGHKSKIHVSNGISTMAMEYCTHRWFTFFDLLQFQLLCNSYAHTHTHTFQSIIPKRMLFES